MIQLTAIKRITSIIILMVLGISVQILAQTPTINTIAYGETVFGRLDGDSANTQLWEITIADHELFEVHLQRIGGQFTPQLTINQPDGSELVPDDIQVQDNDRSWYVFSDTLLQAGTYTISVTGEVSDSTDNPNEYSLSAIYRGVGLSNVDQGLTPLPTRTGDQMPVLDNGSQSVMPIELPYYGSANASQPDDLRERNRWQLQGGSFVIDMDNANPLNRGIQYLSILNNGVGFATVEGAQFYSDMSISQLKWVSSIAEITLEDGRTIQTDFFRIKNIQVVENLVIVTTTSDQRLIFEGQAFDFRRRGGIAGEGPNAEPVNLFNVDGYEIDTELLQWNTILLSTVNLELRVLWGRDMRLISSYLNASIYQQGNQTNPDLDTPDINTNYIDIRLEEANVPAPRVFDYEIDPFGMGDIRVTDVETTIAPLDGRQIVEPMATFRRVFIEDRGILFTREDNSTRLSLPDETNIEAPASILNEFGLQPNDPLFRPRNANNLGEFLYDYHPQVNFDEYIKPVNPVNGNFFYHVDDVELDSHAIELVWTRYYNSLAPDTLTPDYFFTANRPYYLGQMGTQWRHSYQYELDIRYALQGEVWMIMPDGSRHIFRTFDLENPTPTFESNTLMSWQITRLDGLTGRWVARTGDGIRYDFDRAGRLVHIQDIFDNALLFSPAPQELTTQYSYAQGFVVTERYGRRLEVYADNANTIQFVRQQLEFLYEYDNSNQLTRVIYPSILQNEGDDLPNYQYEQGLLIEIRDKRSPFHPEMNIGYDLSTRQVANWTINAIERGGTPAITSTVVYGDTETSTISSFDTIQQTRTITYDAISRVTDLILSDGETTRNRRLNYDGDTTRLFQIREVNGANFSYDFDEDGYLLSINTPTTKTYSFAYQVGTDGVFRQLSSIIYPNTAISTLVYDPDTLRLNSYIQPLDADRSLITTYTYDEFGRIFSVTEPNPADINNAKVTEYTYDLFGYPTQVQVYDTAQDTTRFTLQTAFDLSGRLTEIVDWRGQPISIAWDNQRDLVTSYLYGDPNSALNQVEFVYDEYGQVVEKRVQDLIETFTYNGQHLLASETDAMGRVTNYRYDTFGNLIELIEPVGTDETQEVRIIEYAYNGVNELIQFGVAGKAPFNIEYNIPGTGVPTDFAIIAPDGEATRYVYNVDNQLIQVKDEGRTGNINYNYQLTYDDVGNLDIIQEAHGTGRNLIIDYNLAGLPISTTIADIVTRYDYNHAGELAQITNPDGITTQYNYDVLGNIVQIIMPDHDGLADTPPPTYTYLYDEIGNLISFLDAQGGQTNYTYDALSRLTSMTDPMGEITQYEYDANNNITSLIYPNGNIIRAEYNDMGFMTRWIDGAGDSIVYEYDQANRLIELTERNTVNTTFTYDILDNLVATSIRQSRETLFSYDNANNLISETNALGQTITYNYNNLNRISQIIDTLGNVERYTWTGSSLLNIYTNQANNTFEYTSDRMGRLQQMNTPNQFERFVVSYTDAGLIETIRYNVDSLSDDHTFTYYPNGLLATIQSPDMDGNWSFSYNTMQQLVSMTTPTNDRTQFVYDLNGRVTQMIHPDGSTEDWVYDSVGNVTSYTAPNRTVSTFQYDVNDRVSIREDSFGDTTRQYRYIYSYTAPQLVVYDDQDRATRYYYDDFGNVIRMDVISDIDTDEEFMLTTTYDYDDFNNLLEVTQPSIDSSGTQPVEQFSYNSLNQLTRYLDTFGGSWAFGYDTVGNLSQVNDPLGNVTNYDYDSNNRLLRIEYNSGAFVEFRYNIGTNILSAPENRTQDQSNRTPILYKFDFTGNLVEIEHTPNSIIGFNRDDLGRVTQLQTANGATINFQHNHNHQITNISTPQGTSTRQYDAMGNLVSVTDGGQTASFAYDGFGNLIQFDSNSVTASYEYDTVGNLVNVNNSLTGETSYTYNNQYRVTEMETQGEALTFNYNDVGWVTQITSTSGFNKRIGYTQAGNPSRVTISAGTSSYVFLNQQYHVNGNVIRTVRTDNTDSGLVTLDTLYTYGRNNDLIGERWLNDNNEVIYAVTYNYDLAGNRIQAITYDTDNTPIRIIYVYNRFNQLVEEWRGVPSEVYDRFTGDPTTINAEAQAQEIIEYAYDNAGNLTQLTHPQGTLNYTYDIWNRLIAVSGVNEQGQVVAVTSDYNPLGQLSRMSISGIRYSFLYEQDRLIGIRNDNEQITELYHYDQAGELLWRETANGIEYPVTDALDNIRLWVSADGSNSTGDSGVSYNGFGEVIAPYGALSGQPLSETPQLLYGGQLYEPTSGLYLIGVRAYLPSIGRFIQRDAVRHDSPNNLYTYVQNRPTFAIDPTGMVSELGFIETQSSTYPTITFDNVPREIVPMMPNTLTRVSQVQLRENERLLDIAQSLQAFNPATVNLSTSACLPSINGPSVHMSSLSNFPDLEIDGQSTLWVAPYQPSPNDITTNQGIFSDVEAYMSQAFHSNRMFSTQNCGWMFDEIDGNIIEQTDFVADHQTMRNHLSDNDMFPAFSSELQGLFSPSMAMPLIPSQNPAPQDSSLPVPNLMPDTLYTMQVQTFGIFRDALLPLYPDLFPSNINQPLVTGFAFENIFGSP